MKVFPVHALLTLNICHFKFNKRFFMFLLTAEKTFRFWQQLLEIIHDPNYKAVFWLLDDSNFKMSLYSLWFLAQNVIVITRRAWNKKVRYFFPLLVPVSLKSNESILQGITSWLIPITRWLGKKYHRAKNILKKTKHSLCKKWSFPLRIYSVNVTKSAVSCGFGHIYWRNP